MDRICLIVVFAFILAVNVVAQDNGSPSAKYRGSKIVEISNMLGDADGMECKKLSRPIVGTILKRNFDEDEIMITVFVVRDAKDNRRFINIDSAQMGGMGRQTAGNLSSLLAKGSRVQVVAYECSGGGSGIFTYAEKVKRF
jgi:hypothetical protein